MEETVPASDANRNFSHLLRAVREAGASYTITSHGRPVARIVPIEEDQSAKAAARTELIDWLRSRPVVDIGHWTRDELYDDPQ